jgi:hypothetical protein
MRLSSWRERHSDAENLTRKGETLDKIVIRSFSDL